MRIVHLAAGAASMYCGACARDAAMARALMARGHQVQIVPLYTPLRIEGDHVLPVRNVHMGAINARLEQLSGLFARLPRFITRALDHPALLRLVSRFAVSTTASQLGPMTVSVLAGAQGRQRAQLDRLVGFLEREARPDVVSITNSMLSGIAPEVKRRLAVAVVCEVKGEDGFIEGIPEPHRSEAVKLIRRNARSVDRFVAPGHAYAGQMAGFLDVEPARMAVVRSAVDAERLRRHRPRAVEPFIIGYLSVITPRKGLHVLVEACRLLAEDDRDFRLRVAGQVLSRRYWGQIRRDVRRAGLGDRFEHLGEVPLDEKIALLHSLSAFCQLSIQREALGTTALEAMAAGLPVVVPEEGIFPEMMELTGGGVLFEPEEPEALAAALAGLMDDAGEADRLAGSGAEAVDEHYSPGVVARDMEAILAEAIGGEQRGRGRAAGDEAVQGGEEE
ncbi:MAG: glycosyltransferase family 4 protein [Armatimonadota bacterium]|nr:glycosyltransferase family 4 protein [Armatimonadota bacterium]